MIRTALIGLGNIGLLFDDDTSKKTARSHAKALWQRKEHFELKYAADPSAERRDRLKRLFPKVELFSDAKELSEKKDIDLLAICVPTEKHFSCLEFFFTNSSLKVVLLEKPAFMEEAHYEKVPGAIREKILMNYNRRFPPAIQSVQKKLRSGAFGKPLSARALYSKGIQNNGSHMVDLLNFLLGAPEIGSVEILSAVPDHTPNDPTVAGVLKLNTPTGEILVHLQAGDERECSVFELEILCSRARLTFKDFGRQMEIQEAAEDSISPGYRTLGPPSVISTDLPQSIGFLYDHAKDVLEGKAVNLSPFSDELWNRRLISMILQNTKAKGLL